jgi:uncharacterized membrane protein
LFTFLSIWSVFGILGFAIFTSAVRLNSVLPASSARLGLGIWSIILTAVAMYIAGRATRKFAGQLSRGEGLVHGMIMFGVSVTAVIVLTAAVVLTMSANNSLSGSINTRSPYILSAFAGSEWMAFVALFLGWVAAMIGAFSGEPHKLQVTSSVKEIRPAA